MVEISLYTGTMNSMSNKATTKQKKAVQGIVEGKTAGTAMREAGYSEAMANNPQKLTTSKGFAELMDSYFPDDELLQAHKEGLQATKLVNGVEVPDYATRHRYLKTMYKLKRKYEPEASQPTMLVPFPSDMTDLLPDTYDGQVCQLIVMDRAFIDTK